MSSKVRLISILIMVAMVSTINANMQINLLPGDIKSVLLTELFDPNTVLPNPNQPQSVYTYISQSPLGRIASGQEVFSGKLDELKPCNQARVFSGKLVTSCGDTVKAYTIGDSKELTLSSTFKFPNLPSDVSDVAYTSDDVMTIIAVVSDQAQNKVRFDFKNKEKVVSVLAVNPAYAAFDGKRAYLTTTAVGQVTVALGYHKTGSKLAGTNHIAYGYIKEDGVTTVFGDIQLSKDSQFIEDAVYVTNVNAISETSVFVSYIQAQTNLPRGAECGLSIDAQGKLTLVNCKIINFPVDFKSGFAVIGGKGDKAYIYDQATKIFTLCDYAAQNLINCLSTPRAITPEMNQVVDKLEIQPDGGAHLIFTPPPAQQFNGLNQGVQSVRKTIVYGFDKRIRVKYSSDLGYDQISDSVGQVFTSQGLDGFLLRTTSYSSYTAVGDKTFVVLRADLFKDKTGSVGIVNNDGHNPKIEKTITVTVVDNLNAVQEIKKVPDVSDYADGKIHELSISRQLFTGNNLKFDIVDPAGKIIPKHTQLNINDLIIDAGTLGSKIWFTNSYQGITLDKGILSRFDCTGSIHTENFKCGMSKIVQTPLTEGHTVIYVSSNDFTPEEGIVIVTSDGTNSQLMYFGYLFDEVFIKDLKFGIAEGDVFFKLTGKKYTFWVRKVDQFELYASYNKELMAMPDHPYGIVDSKLVGSDGFFCPKSVTKNPIITHQVDILSNCNEDNRIYSFAATNTTSPVFLGQKSLNSFKSSQLKTCSYGSELLVLDVENGELSTLGGLNDSTITKLNIEQAGFKTVSDIFCIRNKEAAVIVGEDANGAALASVLFGDRSGDANNRYHSTFKLDGKVTRVSQTIHGLIIAQEKQGGAQSFKAVFLNGPYFYTMVDAPYQAVRNIKITSGKTTVKPLNLKFVEFDGTVVVKNPKDQKTLKGIYEFFSLASISGPIFNIEAVGEDSGVTVTPQILPDFSYKKQPLGAENLPEPDFIRQGQGHYAMGFKLTDISTLAYLYQNNDQFMRVDDTGFYCESISVASFRNDYSVVALGCNEGGEFHLRWYLSDWKTGATNRGFIMKYQKAHEITISLVTPTTALVAALDYTTKNVTTYLIIIGNDDNQNKVVTNTKQTATLQEIDHISSFSKDSKAVLIYSTEDVSNLKSISYDSNGAPTPLDNIDLPSPLEIKNIDCRVYNNIPSCLIKNNASFLGDISFDFDGYSNKISVSFKQAYLYYEDYRPIVWDFNESFIIVKAQNFDKEVMLLYRRFTQGDTQIWWGLKPVEYYNLVKTPKTDSVPTVFNKLDKTVFRFTQCQDASKVSADASVFSAHRSQTILLVLGDDLNKTNADLVNIVFNQNESSQKNIPIQSFFNGNSPKPNPPAPTPKDTSIQWWVWVLLFVTVICIGVIVYLTTLLNKQEANGDEEEDYFKLGSDNLSPKNTVTDVEKKTKSGMDSEL